jgi:hypothetical protein
MPKETKLPEKTAKKHSGIPMSERSFAEWQKAFKDMEDCFALLDKKGKAI